MCILKGLRRNLLIYHYMSIIYILIAGNDKEYVNGIKVWLSSNFEMKDMGVVSCILRVRISRDRPKKILSLSRDIYYKNT